MQVDPIKPTLKAPATSSLKLKYDELLSFLAFNFILRRHNWVNVASIAMQFLRTYYLIFYTNLILVMGLEMQVLGRGAVHSSTFHFNLMGPSKGRCKSDSRIYLLTDCKSAVGLRVQVLGSYFHETTPKNNPLKRNTPFNW